MKTFLPLIILLSFLGGCNIDDNNNNSQKPITNPIPEDYLNNNGADIFFLDGYVFSYASDVSWVLKLNYTLGEEIGEITNQTEQASEFEDGSANVLPVGTKIYDTDTQAYIAIVNGKKIPYLKMMEG
ncbi:hypothetical protein [Tenuibacillus multivorans]|uniref:Uncharacterized protein n=1 Tax=Tenuibacillus multivorans TaxID=237069 RepID=A0A1H0AVF7_9BACI|nr:hypothetical protein [Tenuibacillus multivorans]GEL77804.1 hypothetical protein TMU01_20390 [Tenuibacillus multivorans]SDN37344.1 hypothetical protein SAMN05216498_2091 [Tenuibacillus multivorans]